MRVEAEVALKEWAVVCAALGDGRQDLLLRKGGIRERGRDLSARPSGTGFAVEHRSFALLPTYFHAGDVGRARDLVPEVHDQLAQLSSRPPGDRLRVELYAEVTALWHVRELAPLLALAGRHVLSAACVADRFAYRTPGLWVLSLRTYRLAPASDLADHPSYAGCVSWVDLEAPVVGEATAVASAEQHARREAELVEILGARAQ
jgi:hypothetical protein